MPKVCHTDEGIVSDDDFLYCEDCKREYDRCCPDHGPFLQVMDRQVLPGPNPKLAWESCPSFLSVCNSGIKGAGLGIWTEIDLPKGLLFGPYKGIIVKNKKQAQQSGYAWEIRQRGRPLYYIESVDPSTSNWLRFVNCAPTEDRQNLLAFQYAGHIFYKTYKHISAYTELLIWYGDDFGIDLGIGPNEKSTSEKGELTGYVQERNSTRTLFCRDASIREIFKCNIDKEGRIHGKYKVGNYHNHKNVGEFIQGKSKGTTKTENDISGIESASVNLLDKYNHAIQPLVENKCEEFGQSEYLLNDAQIPVGEMSQTEWECVMSKLIKWTNEPCNTDTKLLGCPDCSYQAKYKCEIRWHISVVHDGKMPYKCPHCDHRTSRAAHLREHLDAMHAGKKRYKCPHCDLWTTHLSNLKTHIDGVHTCKKPHKCPHCDHRTTKSSDLNTHIGAVHAKNRPYKCPQCDYSAARKGDLKRHADARHS